MCFHSSIINRYGQVKNSTATVMWQGALLRVMRVFLNTVKGLHIHERKMTKYNGIWQWKPVLLLHWLLSDENIHIPINWHHLVLCGGARGCGGLEAWAALSYETMMKTVRWHHEEAQSSSRQANRQANKPQTAGIETKRGVCRKKLSF